MEPASVVELLSQSTLFGGVGEVALERLARAMRENRFAQGQTLFSRRDLGQGLLLVLEGRIRLSVVSAEGRELIVRHAGAGDILGELAALDGGPRSTDAVAVTPVRAMSLSSAALWQAIEANPAAARSTILFLCERVRSTTEQLEGIALYPIEVRVARFLVSALRISGWSSGAAPRLLNLSLSQNEIALLLGASRPKVNMALAALEQQGAISRGAGGLLCRPDKLVDLCGGEDP